MADTKTTIDDLLAKTPEMWRPVVAEYGPALLAMTSGEFLMWVQMLLYGKTREAWATLMQRMDDNAELVGVGAALSDKWADVNERQAEKLDLQRSAALAVLKVLLSAALAMVGLP